MTAVRVYHNISADGAGRHLAYLDGYQAGDPVVCVFSTEVDRQRLSSITEVTEAMYRLLNIGDDPDFGTPDPRALDYRARGNRSLSVGDLVAIDGDFHACAATGFVPVHHHPAVVVQTRHGTTPLPDAGHECPLHPAGRP